MQRDQLRDLIERVLQDCPNTTLYSPTAVELLMLTAAAESRLGEYIQQISGPALGIFQMEPATEEDIFKNFLEWDNDLWQWAANYTNNYYPFKEVGLADLEFNLAYQIAMARIHYWRSPLPLPDNNPRELAKYWKKIYNTPAGKGSVEHAVRAYLRQ